MSPAPSRSVLGLILVLALLSTLTKAWVVLAPRPDLLGPGTVESPNVSVGEEIHRGNVAAELLDGPLLPVIDYPYAPYFGGSLVLATVAAPCFAVFGRNLFALKLATILLQLVGVAAVVLLLDRYVSRRAAWLGGVLAALAPAGHLVISVQAWGSHCEVGGLALLATYLALRAHESGRARALPHAVAGAMAGLCLWFDYAAAPLLAGLWICALVAWRDVARWSRPGWYVAGLCAGLAPWLLYNWRHDFAGLRIYDAAVGSQLLAPERWLAVPGRAWSFVVRELPAYLAFAPDGSAWLQAVCAAAAVASIALLTAVATRRSGAGAVAGAAWKLPRALAPARVASAQIAVYVAAYLLQGYVVEVDRPLTLRYLTPLWPFVAVALPAALATLGSPRPIARFALPAATATWLVVAGAGWLSLCDASRPGVVCTWNATDPRSLGRWIATRFGTQPDVLIDAIRAARDRRDAHFATELESGVRRTLTFLSETALPLEPVHLANRPAYRRTLDQLESSLALELR